MSDAMLLGVLRMPMPDDPKEMSDLEWVQFRSRAIEAADRIESDNKRFDEIGVSDAVAVLLFVLERDR